MSIPALPKNYFPTTNSVSKIALIDYFRALAIFGVILFHLFPDTIYFGFAGVDIFFVTSGYLFARSYARDQNPKTVLKKRLFRVYPPLTYTCASVLLFFYFFAYPSEVQSVAKSTFTALLAVSNFYFQNQNGYFESNFFENPLLHSWSLSVEIQSYVLASACFYGHSILPDRLKANCNLNHLLLLFILALGLISATQIFLAIDLGYYNPIPRFLEFGMGIFAFQRQRKREGTKFENNIGYSTIPIVSLIFFLFIWVCPSHKMQMGLTFAWVTYIFLFLNTSGSFAWVRYNNQNPILLIGRYSYEIYLMHLPFIVIASMFGAMSIEVLAWIFMHAIFVGIHKVRKRTKYIYHLGFGFIISTFLIFKPSSYRLLTHPLQNNFEYTLSKFPSDANKFLQTSKILFDYRAECSRYQGGITPDWIPDSLKAKISSPNISRDCGHDISTESFDENGLRVLIGDSLAAALIPGLKSNGFEIDSYFISFGCTFEKTYTDFSEKYTHCRENLNAALGFLGERRIDAIFISDASGERDRLFSDLRMVSNAPIIDFNEWPLLRGRGPEVWRLGDLVENAEGVVTPKSSLVRLPRKGAYGATVKNLNRLSIEELICEGEMCVIGTGDEPFFWDRRHVTVSGSREIVRMALEKSQELEELRSTKIK